MEKSKPRRSLWILVIFLLLTFFLCLCLYRWNASRPGNRDAALTARPEIVLAFLPSADADAATVNVMSAAALTLFDEFQAAENQVSVLYWKSGTPPKGPSCAVNTVSTEKDLQAALSRAESGGTLSTALRFAKTLSEESGNLDRKVVLLTDRAPLDGDQSDEGPIVRIPRRTSTPTRPIGRRRNCLFGTRCPPWPFYRNSPDRNLTLHAAF